MSDPQPHAKPDKIYVRSPTMTKDFGLKSHGKKLPVSTGGGGSGRAGEHSLAADGGNHFIQKF